MICGQFLAWISLRFSMEISIDLESEKILLDFQWKFRLIWPREISIGFSMEISIDLGKRISIGFSMEIAINLG